METFGNFGARPLLVCYKSRRCFRTELNRSINEAAQQEMECAVKKIVCKAMYRSAVRYAGTKRSTLIYSHGTEAYY
jgi:hypothetical protein